MEARLKVKNLPPLWTPFPGPQTQALESDADFIFYGGAAGGGKTDLILGSAYTRHDRSIIFRREYPQLKGIVDRSEEIFKERGILNKSDLYWRFPEGKVIEFGAVQHADDIKKYQGRPHDLKAFDEITHFLESQFRFLSGWLRHTNPRQRCQVIATGNPPTDSEGEWIVQFWGPWLDPTHPRPALPGELRWYTTIDGKDVERPDGLPFEHKGDTITPKSRTFIPAHVEDNPFYMASGYRATLQALPEPLRSKMLYGSFEAGREDNAYQVIPTAWVLAAQERWNSTPRPNIPVTCIGVDVARGGGDKTIIAKRYANWFDDPESFPGSSTPRGGEVAALIIQHMGNSETKCNIDVIGVGASVYDIMYDSYSGRAIAMCASEKSEATDKSLQLRFVNKRAEWWWKLREALDPDSGEGLCLPPDRELMSDLCSPRFKMTVRGIQIEAKDEIKKRIGRSPDKGDGVVYAHALEWNVGDNLLAAYALKDQREAEEAAIKRH